MTASNFGYVSAMLVTEFKCLEGETCGSKFVQYTLLVEGRYRLLHPHTYFSGKPTKFNVSPAFKTLVRYRDLLNMHNDLARAYSNLSLPEFPPKKWFGHFSEKFICKRMNLLNDYFRKLLLIEEIRNSECVLKAIQPCKSLDLIVIGQIRAGKAKFVKRFLHHIPPGGQVSGEYSALVNHISTRSVSSTVVCESTVLSEIEQFTPIDLVMDDWLVRVNSIQVRNVCGDLTADDIQKTDLALQQKDGAIVLYDATAEEGERTAQRLYNHFRRRVTCTLVALGTQSDASDSSEYAYNTFTSFIRKIVSC